MANAFKLTAKVIRDAAIILSENLVAANLCNRDIETQYAEKVGDTINVKVVPDLGTADEFTGTTTATDVAESTTPVKLEHHFYKRVDLTSREMSLQVDDFIVQVINPMALTIARSIDAYFIAKWAGSFARYLTGTAGNSPITVDQILAGRQKIFDNLAPYRNMACILDSTAERALLQIISFISADYGPERPIALREGVLGKMHGATFFTSQNASTAFNRGTIAGTVLVNGAAQAGPSLAVDGFTAATGTTLEGARLTIAGITGTYTLVADAVVAGNAATFTLDRALASAPADNAAITFEAAFKQDILFNVRGVAGAIVAPSPLMGGVDGGVESFNGLSVRVGMQGSLTGLSNTIVMDVFAGAKTIYPKAGSIIQG